MRVILNCFLQIPTKERESILHPPLNSVTIKKSTIHKICTSTLLALASHHFPKGVHRTIEERLVCKNLVKNLTLKCRVNGGTNKQGVRKILKLSKQGNKISGWSEFEEFVKTQFSSKLIKWGVFMTSGGWKKRIIKCLEGRLLGT